MGNWKAIAEYLNTGKTTKQVEDHYWDLYMGIHGYCLPQKFNWNDQLVETAALCPETSVDNKVDLESNAKQVFDKYYNGLDNSKTSTHGCSVADLFRIPVTEGYVRGEPVRRDIGKENQKGSKAAALDKQELRDKHALLVGSDLPGYIPLRADFDVEYEVTIPTPKYISLLRMIIYVTHSYNRMMLRHC